MILEVRNGVGVDGVGVNFLFWFLRSCRVCILFVFLHYFHYSFFQFLFRFFPFFFLGFIFVFLCFFVCFFLAFFVSGEFSVFWTFPVAVDCPSVFGHGETATVEKGISLRPRLHKPRQKLSEQCSFFKIQTQRSDLWAHQ